MKKFLILMILLTPFAFSREDAPILPLDNGVYIKHEDNSLDLINVDGMKKRATVKKAKDELKGNSINNIQIDTRYLQHQRALDYVTNPNRTMMYPLL